VTHVNARLNTVEKRAVPKRIKEGGIGGDLLADSSVTTNQLASGAVLSENLAEGSVSTSKIADGSVTAAKLAADALVGIVIPENSIDTPQLVDFAVETAKIANAAVTNIKLGSDIEATKIASGQFATDRIPGLDASKIVSSTFNVDRIPLLPTSKINTSTQFSTALIPNLSASIITTGAFDDGRIPNLDAGKITSGTLSADRIPTLDAGTKLFGTLGIGINTPNGISTDSTLTRTVLAGGGQRYAYVTDGGNFVAGPTAPSDRRLKENIEESALGLNFIKDVNPVQFEFIDKNNPHNRGTQFGFIAQELEQALISNGVDGDNGIAYIPVLSAEEGGSEENYYLVNHEQLISPLIKAVQELSSKNEILEGIVSQLESRITALESS
jgi:hypothetical protein